MKISKNQVLGAISLFGGALVIFGKNRTIKTIGVGVGLGAGSILLSRMYKEESKTIETQCQETEEIFRETGLKPEKLEKTSLLTGTEEGTPVFSEIILREVINSSVLPDEFLEYNKDAYLKTLHIMQNVDKNRVIISIPLPQKSKGKLGPREVRDYFSEVFEDFIRVNRLDMRNFTNQIGVLVTKDDADPPYTYYEEILRDEEEEFPDYINRVASYQREAQSGRTPRDISLDDGDTFVRIEQYLNLEFPVFPEYSNKKGLDVFLATKLINILTGVNYIKSDSGREIQFELSRVAFHPTNDYGVILTYKGGSIVSVDL